MRSIFLQNTRWIIGQGNVSFGFDNWSRVGILQNLSNQSIQNISVSDFLNSECRTLFIPDDISSDAAQTLLSCTIRTHSDDDILVWMPSSKGNFSISSAWNVMRVHSDPVIWGPFIWHSDVPSKIQVFSWKLVQNRVATEANVKRKGISLASKCLCCNKGNEETVPHLFLHSQISYSVWSYFADILQINYSRSDSLLCLMMRFWQANCSGLHKWILSIIPMIIIWEIWLERNNRLFSGQKTSPSVIIRKVTNWISQIFHARLKIFTPKNIDSSLYLIFHLVAPVGGLKKHILGHPLQ